MAHSSSHSSNLLQIIRFKSFDATRSSLQRDKVALQGRGKTPERMASPRTGSSRRSRSLVAIEPAIKAYALGYAADALPALLKALVRFFTLEIKRLNSIRRNAKAKGKAVGHKDGEAYREESKHAATAGLRASDFISTLHAIPTLLKALLKALTESLGLVKAKSGGTFDYQLGMAPACALAILGWSLLNNTLNLLLPSRQAAQTGFKIGAGRELSRRHSEIVTCFISSTMAATGALTLLQLSHQQHHSSSISSSSTQNPQIGHELSSTQLTSNPTEKHASHRNQRLLGFLSSPTSTYFSSSTSASDRTGPNNRASARSAATITPTPLAPGGHFLARLTSLSLGSFSNPSSPSNSRPQTPQLPSSGSVREQSKRIAPSRSHETIISQPLARRGIEDLKEGELAAQLEDALLKQQEQDTDPSKRKEPSEVSVDFFDSRSNSPVLVKQHLHPSSSEHQPPLSTTASSPNAAFKDIRPKSRPSLTIDLTLFALVRGMDTLVRAAPLIASALASSRARSSPVSTSSVKGKARANLSASILGRVAAGLASQAEGLVFVICCAQIMWAWFYHPERLPPSYVRWISGLASMDHRLLNLLRALRSGKPYHWKYGDSTSDATECRDLAEALGYPIRWGNARDLHDTNESAQKAYAEAEAQVPQGGPGSKNEKRDLESGLTIETGSVHAEGSSRRVQAKTNYVLSGAAGPRGRGRMGGFPCEIVHCGVGGSSCLANAGLRWLKGFKVCMGIYVPVHLLPRLIFGFQGFINKPVDNLFKVLKGSARSASFLATYIASIWFMVCFGRTLVLPRIFDMPFNFWDAGLGPALGSFACGFAVFIEEKRKRAEMALYVAPRALFAVAESLKPGWLSEAKKSALWTERVLFGIAVGIVMTSGKYRPDLLRGITSLMAWVVKDTSSKTAIKVTS